MFNCLRCNAEYKENPTYCWNCGKINLVLKTKHPQDVVESCNKHRSTKAIGQCCLCGKILCEDCKSFQGFSFTMTKDYFYCKDCERERKEVEDRYFKKLREKGCCSKHSEEVAVAYCAKCGLPLCKDCIKYKKGFLGIKKGKPLCQSCFNAERTNVTSL